MSTETIQTIIGRAVTDAEFRGLLFRDPAAALAGYELSETEAASLKGLTPEKFDHMALDLEQRMSRSTIGPSHFDGAPGSES